MISGVNVYNGPNQGTNVLLAVGEQTIAHPAYQDFVTAHRASDSFIPGDRYVIVEEMTPYYVEELCRILGKVASDTGAGKPFGIDYRDGYDNPQPLPGF